MRITSCARSLGALAVLVEEGLSQTIAMFQDVAATVGGKRRRIARRAMTAGLAIAAMSAISGRTQAAVLWTEDFTGSTATSNANWASNIGTAAYTNAPSTGPGATDALGFEDADGAIVRIGRLFTPTGTPTSYKLSWDMYSSSNASSQRYYGQICNGTVAVPGSGTGGFFRIAANNDGASKYNVLYSNGATQTVVASTAISVGWHTFSLVVTPGVAGVGSFSYSIDGATPTAIVSSGAVVAPTNVQLGQNVSNGTTGAPDTSAWFDNVKVEEFAAASTAASNPSPPNADTGDSTSTTTSWTVGTNVSKQDIYFGTTLALGSPVVTDAASSVHTYNPGTLAAGTTYYWEVVEKNAVGDPTTATEWSFTTAAAPEPASLLSLGAFGLLSLRRRSRA